MSEALFKKYIQQAITRRKSGNHHNNADLEGYCFDNAFVLYNLLENEGYSPLLVAGLSERYAQPVLETNSKADIESVEQLEGNVHFWVECEEFVLDIAADTFDSPGTPYVGKELPDEYERLEDSLEYAQNILTSDVQSRRCHWCGGRQNYCECPFQTENTHTPHD